MYIQHPSPKNTQTVATTARSQHQNLPGHPVTGTVLGSPAQNPVQIEIGSMLPTASQFPQPQLMLPCTHERSHEHAILGKEQKVEEMAKFMEDSGLGKLISDLEKLALSPDIEDKKEIDKLVHFEPSDTSHRYPILRRGAGEARCNWIIQKGQSLQRVMSPTGTQEDAIPAYAISSMASFEGAVAAPAHFSGSIGDAIGSDTTWTTIVDTRDASITLAKAGSTYYSAIRSLIFNYAKANQYLTGNPAPKTNEEYYDCANGYLEFRNSQKILEGMGLGPTEIAKGLTGSINGGLLQPIFAIINDLAAALKDTGEVVGTAASNLGEGTTALSFLTSPIDIYQGVTDTKIRKEAKIAAEALEEAISGLTKNGPIKDQTALGKAIFCAIADNAHIRAKIEKIEEYFAKQKVGKGVLTFTLTLGAIIGSVLTKGALAPIISAAIATTKGVNSGISSGGSVVKLTLRNQWAEKASLDTLGYGILKELLSTDELKLLFCNETKSREQQKEEEEGLNFIFFPLPDGDIHPLRSMDNTVEQQHGMGGKEGFQGDHHGAIFRIGNNPFVAIDFLSQELATLTQEAPEKYAKDLERVLDNILLSAEAKIIKKKTAKEDKQVFSMYKAEYQGPFEIETILLASMTEKTLEGRASFIAKQLYSYFKLSNPNAKPIANYPGMYLTALANAGTLASHYYFKEGHPKPEAILCPESLSHEEIMTILRGRMQGKVNEGLVGGYMRCFSPYRTGASSDDPLWEFVPTHFFQESIYCALTPEDKDRYLRANLHACGTLLFERLAPSKFVAAIDKMLKAAWKFMSDKERSLIENYFKSHDDLVSSAKVGAKGSEIYGKRMFDELGNINEEYFIKVLDPLLNSLEKNIASRHDFEGRETLEIMYKDLEAKIQGARNAKDGRSNLVAQIRNKIFPISSELDNLSSELNSYFDAISSRYHLEASHLIEVKELGLRYTSIVRKLDDALVSGARNVYGEFGNSSDAEWSGVMATALQSAMEELDEFLSEFELAVAAFAVMLEENEDENIQNELQLGANRIGDKLRTKMKEWETSKAGVLELVSEIRNIDKSVLALPAVVGEKVNNFVQEFVEKRLPPLDILCERLILAVNEKEKYARKLNVQNTPPTEKQIHKFEKFEANEARARHMMQLVQGVKLKQMVIEGEFGSVQRLDQQVAESKRLKKSARMSESSNIDEITNSIVFELFSASAKKKLGPGRSFVDPTVVNSPSGIIDEEFFEELISTTIKLVAMEGITPFDVLASLRARLVKENQDGHQVNVSILQKFIPYLEDEVIKELQKSGQVAPGQAKFIAAALQWHPEYFTQANIQAVGDSSVSWSGHNGITNVVNLADIAPNTNLSDLNTEKIIQIWPTGPVGLTHLVQQKWLCTHHSFVMMLQHINQQRGAGPLAMISVDELRRMFRDQGMENEAKQVSFSLASIAQLDLILQGMSLKFASLHSDGFFKNDQNAKRSNRIDAATSTCVTFHFTSDTENSQPLQHTVTITQHPDGSYWLYDPRIQKPLCVGNGDGNGRGMCNAILNAKAIFGDPKYGDVNVLYMHQ